MAKRREPGRVMQVAIYRLGQEPPDDLSATTTAAERVAMMWQLTLEAWELANRTLPSYTRRTMPIALARLERGRLPRPG